jgi:hypothetical protein
MWIMLRMKSDDRQQICAVVRNARADAKVLMLALLLMTRSPATADAELRDGL